MIVDSLYKIATIQAGRKKIKVSQLTPLAPKDPMAMAMPANRL